MFLLGEFSVFYLLEFSVYAFDIVFNGANSLYDVREHFMKRFYGGLAPHNGGVFSVPP